MDLGRSGAIAIWNVLTSAAAPPGWLESCPPQPRGGEDSEAAAPASARIPGFAEVQQVQNAAGDADHSTPTIGPPRILEDPTPNLAAAGRRRRRSGCDTGPTCGRLDLIAATQSLLQNLGTCRHLPMFRNRSLSMPKSPEQQILELIRSARVLRPRDLDRLSIAREYLSRLHAKGLLDRPGRGLYVAANDRAHREPQPGRGVQARSPRSRLPALGSAVPRADHPGPVRGLAGHRRKGSAAQGRLSATADRAVLRPRPDRRDRGACHRRRDGARLRPGQDGGGLLQVPQQDRPGCRPGSPPRLLEAAQGDDGSALAGGTTSAAWPTSCGLTWSR